LVSERWLTWGRLVKTTQDFELNFLLETSQFL